jgi:hypothetical protein
MARVYQTRSLTMGFCLDCHSRASKLRDARASARSGEAGEEGGEVQPALFGRLAIGEGPALWLGPKRHDSLTTCSACHR